MINKESLIDKIKENDLENILNEQGEVFFSGRNLLSGRNNGIVFMGLNPAGEPNHEEKIGTIKENLGKYFENEDFENYSGFIDRCWHKPYTPDKKKQSCDICNKPKEKNVDSDNLTGDKMQVNVQRLAQFFGNGFTLGQSVSYNAFWMQTKNTTGLIDLIQSKRIRDTKKQDILINEFTNHFFPIHKFIFEEIRPKVIICLGNGENYCAYACLKYAFSNALTSEPNIQPVSIPGGKNLSIKHSKVKLDSNEILLIGLPHPSRYHYSENFLNQFKATFANHFNNLNSNTK